MPSGHDRVAESFEQLVTRHLDLVYHVALAWVRDPGEAADVTQMACIKAWQGFAGFRSGTNFKAWILTILRHAIVDRQRAAARAPGQVPLDRLGPGDEPAAPEAGGAAVDVERLAIAPDAFGDEIAAMLDALPREQQLAVLLCDVEGLSYQDVAEALGVPIGTARSRIHRGRARLAAGLRDYAQRLGYGGEHSR